MLAAQRASKPSQAANAGRMVLLPEQLQLLQWQGEILVGMNKICACCQDPKSGCCQDLKRPPNLPSLPS